VTDLQLAWLAGLLEGEGSFFTTTSRTGGHVYRYPQIRVNMTDRDVIERVAALFGTGVYTSRPYGVSRKTSYKAILTGLGAADLMRALRPLMGERRQSKIDEVLAEWDGRTPTAERRRATCSAAAAGRARRTNGTFDRSGGGVAPDA